MDWARFALIVIGAIVSSLTDWFFAGDWLHRRYTYPEIWRQGNESRGDCPDQSAAFPDLRYLCLCHRPAGSSFRGKHGQLAVAV